MYFSKKTHDNLRKAQLILAAATGALGILTASLDLGVPGIIAATLLSAANYAAGYLAEHDSDDYYAVHEIVPKQIPAEETKEEEIDG